MHQRFSPSVHYRSKLFEDMPGILGGGSGPVFQIKWAEFSVSRDSIVPERGKRYGSVLVVAGGESRRILWRRREIAAVKPSFEFIRQGGSVVALIVVKRALVLNQDCSNLSAFDIAAANLRSDDSEGISTLCVFDCVGGRCEPLRCFKLLRDIRQLHHKFRRSELFGSRRFVSQDRTTLELRKSS